eukprot:3136698-Pyramimonas_sp.AAC.1
MARHCAEYAQSPGGWVYAGDLVREMRSDGTIHAAAALAAHGLTMLPSGEIDVLGVETDEIM